MDSDALSFLYTIVGVIVGGLITAITSIYVQKKNFKNEVYFRKSELCSKAIEYIRIFYKAQRQEKTGQTSNLSSYLEKEGETFKEFYDELILLSSDRLRDEFEDLRAEIQKKSEKGLSYFVEKAIEIMKRELGTQGCVFHRRQK